MQTENDEPKKEEPKETTTEQSWDDYPDDCDEDADGYSDEIDEEQDEFDEAMDNCGQVPGGGCMLVGTEYCDWECPFAKSMWANMQKKRDAKGRYTK